MYSVILCGGSGTRLWPLSRKNFPKQFLKLYSEKSLLQETFLRMAGLIPKDNVFLVTNEENFFNVYNQLREIYPEIRKDRIIIEPASLNTTPAIMLAVKYLKDVIKIGEDEPIIEVHSDHYIGKKDEYLKIVENSLKNLGENIALIGITPTKPDTGFGYIEKGERAQECWKVASFKEKPDFKTAEEFVACGRYCWNAGMYAFTIKSFARELEKHAPELFAYFSEPYDAFIESFKSMPSIAIDYAIAEKSDKMIMFEGDFDWSDVGSFDVLSEIAKANDNINTKHVAIDSNNIYVHSSNNRLIATLGVDDINIIENNDVILVQKKGRSEDVKKVVEFLKENKYREVDHNIEVYRPWGKYEVLIDEKNHKVKKITVYPGSKLSLQSHEHRAEHWVVVKGTARVVNGENILVLHENESTYIPAKAKHRLENSGAENLEIIEVQTGDYLEEDDIVRYDDEFGRN